MKWSIVLALLSIWMGESRSLETDDVKGLCTSQKFPLNQTMKKIINDGNVKSKTTTEDSTGEPTDEPTDATTRPPRRTTTTQTSRRTTTQTTEEQTDEPTDEPTTETTKQATKTAAVRTTKTTQKTTAAPAPGICTREGFFRDPNDCTKFYRCVQNGNGFTKYNFNCGSGTVFNERNSNCDWPYNVPECNK